MRAEHRPRLIGDLAIADEFVNRAQQGRLELTPERCIGSPCDPADFEVGQSCVACDEYVLDPFIAGLLQHCDPHDDELALTLGQCGREQQIPVEGEIGSCESWMMGHRAHDVRSPWTTFLYQGIAAVRRHHRGECVAHFGWPLRCG